MLFLLLKLENVMDFCWFNAWEITYTLQIKEAEEGNSICTITCQTWILKKYVL